MKTTFRAAFVVGLLISLSGCAAGGLLAVAPPSEEALTVQPFVITVPKNVESASNTISGVKFGSFENRSGEMEFFSVNFSNSHASDELLTRVCKGNVMRTGNRYQSCVFLDSRIAVQDDGESNKITITPYRVRSVQARDAIGIPLPLPEVDITNWYRWVSNHEVAMSYKLTSEYGPESIKGNFDRSISRYTWRAGEVDSALRRFKDTYVMDLGSGRQARIGAAFFPYRDGSIVELYIRGEGSTQAGVMEADWDSALARVKAELERVVSQ